MTCDVLVNSVYPKKELVPVWVMRQSRSAWSAFCGAFEFNSALKDAVMSSATTMFHDFVVEPNCAMACDVTLPVLLPKILAKKRGELTVADTLHESTVAPALSGRATGENVRVVEFQLPKVKLELLSARDVPMTLLLAAY